MSIQGHNGYFTTNVLGNDPQGNYWLNFVRGIIILAYPKIPIKGRALYSRTNVFRVLAEALKVRKSKKYKRNYRSTLKVAD